MHIYIYVEYTLSLCTYNTNTERDETAQLYLAAASSLASIFTAAVYALTFCMSMCI